MTYEVHEYIDATGQNPYRSWLERLDIRIRARIQARVFRFETGNLGDVKALGGSIYEARFDIGPEYRLYFARDRGNIILLLCGDAKKSQRKDIEKARRNWNDYRSQ